LPSSCAGAGAAIVDAAIEAAELRLRPILMTSFAFILGVLPLYFATGAGALGKALGGHGDGGRHAVLDRAEPVLYSGALRDRRLQDAAKVQAERGSSESRFLQVA
jgi:hypothetical protein